MLMPPARQRPGGGAAPSHGCARGVGSGLREGSVRSQLTKMEQCRNSLAGRRGKRASSSGGASLLPRFLFLFLLPPAWADSPAHLPLPPGSTVAHRHGYRICILSPRRRSNARPVSKTLSPCCHRGEAFSTMLKQSKNKYCHTLKHQNQNESGRMLEEEGWPQNLLNKDCLLVPVFNTSSFQDKKKKNIWPAVSLIFYSISRQYFHFWQRCHGSGLNYKDYTAVI